MRGDYESKVIEYDTSSSSSTDQTEQTNGATPGAEKVTPSDSLVSGVFRLRRDCFSVRCALSHSFRCGTYKSQTGDFASF